MPPAGDEVAWRLWLYFLLIRSDHVVKDSCSPHLALPALPVPVERVRVLLVCGRVSVGGEGLPPPHRLIRLSVWEVSL